MVVCKRCGKENQEHYKFCLGCGAEISAPGVGNAAMAKTMHADSAGPSSQSMRSVSPPAVSRGGAALPGVAPGPAQPAAAPAMRPCPNCGFEVPTNFLFCGACGNSLKAATPVAAPAVASFSPQPKVAGNLTLIRPDGTEGGVFDLEPGSNKLGRAHGELFQNDGYLSPLHAELIVNAAGGIMRDLDSLNGVFVRLSEEHVLKPGDIFRIGQELLRFDGIRAPVPLEDGTEVMGSPNPGYWGRVSVIIGRDIDGSAFPLLGEAVTFGRERGDINFPDDGYVSGLHAKLAHKGGKACLSDLGSSNGTFVKITNDYPVKNGSFVLLGQQLFRLMLNG